MQRRSPAHPSDGRRRPGGADARRGRQGGAIHPGPPYDRCEYVVRPRAPNASAADRRGRGHRHRLPAAVLPAAATRSSSTTRDSSTRRYIEINYGPWDRLEDDRPFIPGVGDRPPGAALYPPDVTKDELERTPDLLRQYAVVRRDSGGRLIAVPYHQAFEAPMRHAAERLRAAAALADDAGLRRYLELRARALETDDYQPSDLAWLDMKSNTVDVVIGPIETLHRPPLRLQDRGRGLCADQGQGVERPSRPVRRAAARAAARPAGARGVQAGAAGHRFRPQRVRRGLLRRRCQRRLEDDRDQPAERRTGADSRRAPGGCSSRTSCGPSSIGFWCRSPAS